MEPHEVDSLLRSLVGIAAHQDTINADLRTCIERLTADIERLDVTQARIETLLARMRRQEENGQDA
jgi:hypothetical protein